MTKCNAVIKFGDDYGDNDCTFHCELEEGHEGKHLETGTVRGTIPYSLTWEGNVEMIRAKCPKCGNEENVEKRMWDIYHADHGGYDCLMCETMMEIVQ
jgi:hypothetical protein